MLKTVCFENVINYKDYQRLDFADGANFIIGANSSGKSSILELTRRCLSSDLNTSISSVYNRSNAAFILSWYDLTVLGDSNLGILRRRFEIEDLKLDTLLVGVHYKSNICRKFVVFERNRTGNKGLSFYAVSYISHKRNQIDREPCYVTMTPEDINYSPASINDALSNEKKQSELLKKIGELTHKAENCVSNRGNKVQKLLQPITKLFGKSFLSQKDIVCENILGEMSKYFIMVFPVRGIGCLQWSKSKKITGDKRQDNYKEASSRAEILNSYLEGKETDVDEKEVTRIFQTITYPSIYKFCSTEKGIIIAPRRYKIDHKNIPVLKCPEGVIEAMQMAIILANKKYTTVTIEDPDRGMHPQMIRKLLDLVLKSIKNKTIIIVSHNPSMVSKWTLTGDDGTANSHKNAFYGRTFYCREVRKDQNVTYHTVSAFPGEYSKLAVREEYKAMLFATKIIFVEGETDKIVLWNLLCGLLEDEHTPNTIKQHITTLHIVDLNGKEKYPIDLSKSIGINYVTIKDRDAVIDVRERKGEIVIKKQSIERAREVVNELEKNGKLSKGKTMLRRDFERSDEFTAYLKSLNDDNQFAWRCGDLEDVLGRCCPRLTINISDKEFKFPLQTKNKKEDFKTKLKTADQTALCDLTSNLIKSYREEREDREDREDKDSEIRLLLDYIFKDPEVRHMHVNMHSK